MTTGINDESLEKLKAESAAAEADKWEKVGERKKKLLVRTSLIGAGMCFLVGFLFGANLLILFFGSILIAGGATALAIKVGLGSTMGALVLGGTSMMVVFLARGGVGIMVPLLTFPLAMAVFIGFRLEADM